MKNLLKSVPILLPTLSIIKQIYSTIYHVKLY